MMIVTTLFYYTPNSIGSRSDQPLYGGRVLCLCPKSTWQAGHPASQESRQNATGGASAIV